MKLVGSTTGAEPAANARARIATRSARAATASIGGLRLTQQVSGGQSYLSSSEKTLTFGLGPATKIDALEIRWPDGATQTLRDVPGGSRLTITERPTP